MPTKKTTKTATKKVAKKTTKKTTKTATKKVAKKAAGKQASKQQSKAKVLVCVDGTECFWTNDGQILHDLTELRDALADMEVAVFGHHVTSDKNDFADWVEHVLQDIECAADLRKAKKPTTAKTTVVRHLKLYAL